MTICNTHNCNTQLIFMYTTIYRCCSVFFTHGKTVIKLFICVMQIQHEQLEDLQSEPPPTMEESHGTPQQTEPITTPQHARDVLQSVEYV